MSLEVVILAAGKGTRMRSKLPKVLHPLAGKPMVQRAIEAAADTGADKIHVVIGHGADEVKARIDHPMVSWALQEEQKGTGHAVAQAMPAVADDATVLVTYGDVPLVSSETLQRVVDACDDNTLVLLTAILDDPTGYGRIVRDDSGAVQAIVEQKDASEEQLAIQEVNTGMLALKASYLKQWLPLLSSDNAQGEYYLTDLTGMAVENGLKVAVEHPDHLWEVDGVNNRLQLNQLERRYQAVQAEALMLGGATLADAKRVDVRGNLVIGEDISIDVNCVFEGSVMIGDDVVIGPNCYIKDSKIGAGSVIKANSVLEEAVLEEGCDVGPFARLRPGTVLSEKAKVGNFVETKKAHIGKGSKVNHLSYIGDSEIGEKVNVGAGTITCNYDGVNKSKTVMGDGVFIGSNSSLVAPVNIGANATVGAGSVITGDVGAEELAVARGKQRNISGWKRPTKKS